MGTEKFVESILTSARVGNFGPKMLDFPKIPYSNHKKEDYWDGRSLTIIS